MKNRVTKKIAVYLSILMTVLIIVQSKNVYAATTYNITYADVEGNAISSPTVIDEGNSIGTLPTVTDLIAWVDDDNRVVSSTTIPASDMTLTAITSSDVSSHGTMDSGNIVWYIIDGKLVVTGDGTITILERYAKNGVSFN